MATAGVGRKCIELIKDHYDSGDGSFSRAVKIRDWLKSEHGIKAKAKTVRDWDRQARLERADEGKPTTFPSRSNGYTRQAAPTHSERVTSRESRHKDTRTRVHNDYREARADAQQADASEIEQYKVVMLKAAYDLLSGATQEGS